jgi:NADH-ubiquinone oxidoreductase chain 4
MIKIIFFIFFMIPLCFLKNFIWLNQFLYFFLFFLFLLNFSYSSYFTGIRYFLGCDFLSFFMILLSIWICSLMLMASEKLNKDKYFMEFFSFTLLIMLLSLYLTFGSINLFIFYLFFEVRLIPTLILILG